MRFGCLVYQARERLLCTVASLSLSVGSLGANSWVAALPRMQLHS